MNVYLAAGSRKGQQVMKVGATSNLKKRQSQIGITIELAFPCDTRFEALNLETKFRRFLRSSGAIQLAGFKDWFIFDAATYEQLKTFFSQQASIISQRRRAAEQHIAQQLTETDSMQHQIQELHLEIAKARADHEALLSRLHRAETLLELYESGRLQPPKQPKP